MRNLCYSKCKWPIRLFILLVVCLTVQTLVSCDESDQDTTDQEYVEFIDLLRDGVVSEDGTFAISVSNLSISESLGGRLWYDKSYYTARMNIFHGWEGRCEVKCWLYNGGEMVGEIILKHKKRHSKDEITVSVTGLINISSLRLKRGHVPEAPKTN